VLDKSCQELTAFPVTETPVPAFHQPTRLEISAGENGGGAGAAADFTNANGVNIYYTKFLILLKNKLDVSKAINVIISVPVVVVGI